MRRNSKLHNVLGLALGLVVATAVAPCAMPAPALADASEAIELAPIEQDASGEAIELYVESDAQDLEPQAEQTLVWHAPAGEDLIGSYIEHCFADAAGTDDDIAVETQSSKTVLSAKGLEQLERLKKMVADVAAGKRTSTVFEIDVVNTCGKQWWTAQELGVNAIADANGNVYDEAIEALFEVTGLDGYTLLDCLHFERPYDLYWIGDYGDYTPWYVMNTGEGWKLGFASRTYSIQIPVADNYAAGEFEVDPACGQRISKAVNNAKSIAAQGKNLSAFDRLALFKGRIRELAFYDTQAAQGNATSNDPWQMVSVFDGDKNTNVVCEGFAKAFKYLCDLASISGVECRRVDGTLGGAGHMWNIVRMDDGRNYIADVTNCAGGTKVEDDPLFLGACTSGNVANGYKFKAWGIIYHYTYFDGTTNFYTNEELALSKTPYASNSLTANKRSNSVNATYSKTKNRTTKANVSVSNARGAVTYANASTNTTAKRFVVNNTSGTVSIPKGTAVGTYTVVIKVTAAGNANYKSGSKTVSYKVTVGKATNGLKVKTSKKTVKYAKVSKKKQVVQPIKATGANGTVSYKKVSKGSSKYLSVNKKTGKVTVSKGAKKGTYTIKVQVSAAGNKNFKKATKTVTCKVVVS